jgi:hypothetical protein
LKCVRSGDKFRVRAKRGPSPNVAPAFLLLFARGVLFFCATEGPNFIALNPGAFQTSESFVLIFGAGRTQFHQQLLNRRAMNAGNADG